MGPNHLIPIPPNYTCPEVLQADCASKSHDELCYWRGPAFYSDARPTKYGDYPPNLTQGDSAGLRLTVKQRLKSQNSTDTMSGWPSLQYWNEVTIDGKVLGAVLKTSPQAAVAAIMYVKGDTTAKGWAHSFNADLKKEWNFMVPIVAMNLAADMRASGGPFSVAESFEEVSVSV